MLLAGLPLAPAGATESSNGTGASSWKPITDVLTRQRLKVALTNALAKLAVLTGEVPLWDKAEYWSGVWWVRKARFESSVVKVPTAGGNTIFWSPELDDRSDLGGGMLWQRSSGAFVVWDASGSRTSSMTCQDCINSAVPSLFFTFISCSISSPLAVIGCFGGAEYTALSTVACCQGYPDSQGRYAICIGVHRAFCTGYCCGLPDPDCRCVTCGEGGCGCSEGYCTGVVGGPTCVTSYPGTAGREVWGFSGAYCACGCCCPSAFGMEPSAMNASSRSSVETRAEEVKEQMLEALEYVFRDTNSSH